MADRRSRQRESGERRNIGSRSASRHHVSSPDERRSDHNNFHQTLPLDSTAALKRANIRLVSPHGSEEELERTPRPERRETQRREQGAREGRGQYQEVDAGSPRAHRKRDSRTPLIAPLPPPSPPTQPLYDEDTATDYQNELREMRRQRASRAYEPPRDDSPDMESDDEHELRDDRQRKTRITAGSVPTEKVQPRVSLWERLRGGGGANASTSYSSFDSKDEGYDEEPRKAGFWTRKKICKSHGYVLSDGTGLIS